MALSRAVRSELSTERRDLIAKRKAIENRLAAIDLLLSDEAAVTPVSGRDRAQSSTRRPRPTAKPSAAQGEPIGLRDALRMALEAGDYMKPAEVIELLGEAGYTVTGKTPLKTRVYNELKRMRNEGLLKRDELGKYALVTAA